MSQSAATASSAASKARHGSGGTRRVLQQDSISLSSTSSVPSNLKPSQVVLPPTPGGEDPWEQEIIVYVKQQTGKTETLQVRRVDTIGTVKELLALRNYIPKSLCVLKANGVEPADDEVLMNLDIGNNFTFTNEYRI